MSSIYKALKRIYGDPKDQVPIALVSFLTSYFLVVGLVFLSVCPIVSNSYKTVSWLVYPYLVSPLPSTYLLVLSPSTYPLLLYLPLPS